MIQIYAPDNTDFEKNGDMTLLAVSAQISAELNGAWQATVSCPIDEEGRYQYLTDGAVVKMPSFNGEQLFRVKSKEKSDDGITASLEPIFYDSMEDCFLVDVRPTMKNGQDALNIMTAPNAKYSGESDIQTLDTAYYQYKNLMEAINGDGDNTFIKRWGGEILFDNFKVIINERVGADRGVELRYGKNIPVNGLTEEVDLREVVTRIYPKAYNGYTLSGDGYADSPLINSYPTIKCGAMTFDDVKMRADASEEEEPDVIVCDTQEELDAALISRCNEQFSAGLDKPKVTITANMVLLSDTEQYAEYAALETVSLGDTIHCVHHRLGIVTDARVISLTYDPVQKKVQGVTLGNFAYNYFQNVTSSVNRIESRIDSAIRPDGSVIAEQVKGIINAINASLALQSTAAQKVDGRAFLIEDTDPDSDLYGAMEAGTQGLRIAKEKSSQGNWVWKTAITAKGIIADAIVTGLLASQNGITSLDMESGELTVIQDVFKTILNKLGLTLKFYDRNVAYMYGQAQDNSGRGIIGANRINITDPAIGGLPDVRLVNQVYAIVNGKREIMADLENVNELTCRYITLNGRRLSVDGQGYVKAN